MHSALEPVLEDSEPSPSCQNLALHNHLDLTAQVSNGSPLCRHWAVPPTYCIKYLSSVGGQISCGYSGLGGG